MVENPTGTTRSDTRGIGADALAPLIAKELDAVLHTLGTARTRQWEASPVPRPRVDSGRKAAGGVPDPTADIVADTRRLKVSHEVGRAERLLAGVYERLVEQRACLERAVARFDGAA